MAYWSPSAAPGQAPTLCDPGVTAPSSPGLVPGICPNGLPAPCLLPVHVVSTNPTVLNFNCLVNTTSAPFPTIQDNRVFNLEVLNAAGKYVFDGYLNPSLPTLAANRQARVVTAFPTGCTPPNRPTWVEPRPSLASPAPASASS